MNSSMPHKILIKVRVIGYYYRIKFSMLGREAGINLQNCACRCVQRYDTVSGHGCYQKIEKLYMSMIDLVYKTHYTVN